MTRALKWLIYAYQGLRYGQPPSCRFTPSCSRYALDAFEHHGVWRGAALTARRIVRCRPGASWGYDPVPDPSVRLS